MANKQQLTRAEQRKRILRKRRRTKILLTVFFTFLVLIVAGIIVFFASGVGGKVIDLYKNAKKVVAESTVDTFKASQTSMVYDVNGELISSVSGEKDVQYLELDEIPDAVKDAFISVEDKNFYSHKGFDVKAILRAAQSIVKNSAITQGGSTITQQLSRNIFLSFEVSWQRKVAEIFISVELEKKYTKDQILEFYINNIYYANGYYGIEAAAQGYFSKSAAELDLSQLVFLCSIPNNPTLYDPIDNPDNTVKRRDRMLKAMLDENCITQEEYDSAVAEQIVLSPAEEENNNYVETYVFYCATRALMKHSGFQFQYEFDSDKEKEAYDDEYQEMYVSCQKTLYTGGYRIYTSIDMEKQALLQSSVDEALSEFTEVSEENIYTLQGAATCIDNATGNVVAIVGGRSQDVTGYTLNRAYQSYRQPGSAIKPLVVYTPSFENGYTPDTEVNDHQFEGGPSNADDSYAGYMTLRSAVAYSKNTVAWQILEDLTPSVGLSYLKAMHFSKIVEDDNTLSTALGGLTNGASTVEMASGFATLENDGLFREPTCIIKILDSEGGLVLSNDNAETEIYETNAARMMTNVLESAMEYGTGRRISLEDMPCAGKTGTTNSNKDGWFCGYTHYYTTAVWVGYDIPREMKGLEGATYPGRIWKAFMEEVHQDLEPVEFEMYEENNSEPKAEEIVYTEPPEPEESEAPTTAPSEEPSETPQASQTPVPEVTSAPEPVVTEAPAAEPAPTEAPVVTEAPVENSTEEIWDPPLPDDFEG